MLVHLNPQSFFLSWLKRINNSTASRLSAAHLCALICDSGVCLHECLYCNVMFPLWELLKTLQLLPCLDTTPDEVNTDTLNGGWLTSCLPTNGDVILSSCDRARLSRPHLHR